MITYNGVVTLRNLDQAKKFGKKLYMHLSKGGKVVVTPELIRRLFEERRELVNTDAAEMEQHAAEMANITSAHATAGLFDDKGHEVEVFLSFLICTSLLFFLNIYYKCMYRRSVRSCGRWQWVCLTRIT